MFEDAADTAILGAGHSDVIKRMIFTCVTDVEPGSVYLCDTAGKGDKFVSRNEV